MSERLKADAALVWANESLSRVPYLTLSSGAEEEFLASAALALRTLVFCRSETLLPFSLLFSPLLTPSHAFSRLPSGRR